MKNKFLLLIGLMVSFLSGCAQMHPVERIQNNEAHAGQLALSHDNHDALAKHHEEIAKEMQKNLEEQKKLLQEYEDYSYFYGRRVQDLRSHTEANIRYYERLLQENLKEAAIQRKMAEKQKERNYSDSTIDGDAKPVEVTEDLHEDTEDFQKNDINIEQAVSFTDVQHVNLPYFF